MIEHNPAIQAVQTENPATRTLKPDLFQILSVLLYAFILVRLFLWGGWGIAFFLFILLTECFLFSWSLRTHFQQKSKPDPLLKKWPLQTNLILIGLTAAILSLAACYALWSNLVLRVINFPVLIALLLMQYLIIHQASACDWDHPFFWLEAGLSCMIRPFHRINLLKGLFRRSNGQPHDVDRHKTVKKQIGAILIGILIALPLLLIAGSLLASADAVFAERLSVLKDWIGRLSLSLLARQILLAVCLAPFIYSMMESGRQQKQIIPDSVLPKWTPNNPGIQQQSIKTILITVLICVNLLYFFFVMIQFRYLTGAIQSMLPQHLTYAEYARSGFFELLAVSLLNVSLLFAAIRLANREKGSGIVLRFLVLMLLGCSIIQWLSAMSRMKLYVDAYGLTRLRFLSTAFMWLILAWFVILALREFLSRLPLFKSLAIAAIIALLALNSVNPDLRIAKYNVQRYQKPGDHTIISLDVSYLEQLSDDALPAIISLLHDTDPVVVAKVKNHLNHRLDELQQIKWQNLNLSQWMTRKALDETLGD